MWFTTRAQLRRPASMRALMACGDPDTQAGALGTMRAKKRLAEKLGIQGDAVRPTPLGPTMNEESKNEAC
jgi:hypothetical protein